MTFEDFRRLTTDAAEFDCVEDYIDEIGGSAPAGVSDANLTEILEKCWTYGREHSITALRKTAGISRAEMSRTYGIPVRTLESWEATSNGARSAPGYVIDLLAYAVIDGAR